MEFNKEQSRENGGTNSSESLNQAPDYYEHMKEVEDAQKTINKQAIDFIDRTWNEDNKRMSKKVEDFIKVFKAIKDRFGPQTKTNLTEYLEVQEKNGIVYTKEETEQIFSILASELESPDKEISPEQPTGQSTSRLTDEELLGNDLRNQGL